MFVSVGLTNNLRFSSQLAVIISANSKDDGDMPKGVCLAGRSDWAEGPVSGPEGRRLDYD